MMRILKILGLLILLLLITAAVLIGSAFIGRQSITDGAEISGIHIVKDGIVSVAIVPINEKEVALIDAGNDPSGKAILAGLAKLVLGAENVTVILLTHGHADHTAAIHLFPKAQVMALEPEVGLVEGTAGSSGPLTRLMPVKPTGLKVARVLHDGETLNLGDVPVRVLCVLCQQATRRAAPPISLTVCCSSGTLPTCTTTAL